MKEKINKKIREKLNLKGDPKDPKEKAKIELIIYGIFFLIIIILGRIGSINIPEKEVIEENFINKINDNYEYNIVVDINDNIYNYHGKALGNNGNLTKEDNYYYIMNKKYYVLDNGNYILTTKEEIYDNIDYKYLDINTIKEYISLGTKENNTYNIKVSDIILNSDNNNYITIDVDNINNEIIIDYTNLLKIEDNTITKALVTITYSNIDKIMSLEE